MVIVAYPGVTLLDVTGPAQVFSTANDLAAEPFTRYEVVLASRTGGVVPTDTGIGLATASLKAAAAKPIDTLLVAGGLGVFDAANDEHLTAWFQRQALRSRRAGSTCMGTFLMAAAGLLTGKRAATHWRWCDELQKRYPNIVVQRDPIFVRDGAIWSSAGVTAGIDLALAMVEEDHDHRLAAKVSSSLVVFLKRPGGQSQFSAALMAQADDANGRFSALHAWIADNLDKDLRVERLAERAGMSARSFARTYTAYVGTTPAKAVERMRVEAAKSLLVRRGVALATVARRSGFHDKERMRRAFTRQVGVSPVEFRSRFSSADN